MEINKISCIMFMIGDGDDDDDGDEIQSAVNNLY